MDVRPTPSASRALYGLGTWVTGRTEDIGDSSALRVENERSLR